MSKNTDRISIEIILHDKKTAKNPDRSTPSKKASTLTKADVL